MKILNKVYVKQLNPSGVKLMLHLGDTCKREAKYSRVVYADTYAEIKQTRVVHHNFSFKDAFCLPQQLLLISII